MSQPPDDVITAARAATILHVRPATVVRWVTAGRLRGWRAGRKYLVSEAEARALLEPVGTAAVAETPRTHRQENAAAEAAMKRLRMRGWRC